MTTPLYDWQAPISLGAPSLPIWPVDIFPEPIQKFVTELSASTETPIEMPSLCVLAVIATASHGKYRVQIKPDYSEPVNVWTCVALPSGSRKTAVIEADTEPLMIWEQKNKSRLNPSSKMKFLK